VPFFERCGFRRVARHAAAQGVDRLRALPARHACDEVAVVLDLVPGASERAAAAALVGAAHSPARDRDRERAADRLLEPADGGPRR
jgi:hypothetical protein